MKHRSPTTAETAALQTARRLRRLREELVGMMIGCPLSGVTAAAEHKLIAADLDDDELATVARTAIEIVGRANGRVGQGIRSSDVTPFVLGVATCRLGHRVHDGEQYGEPVPWLTKLAADARAAVDPNDSTTWTRRRFASAITEVRSLAPRVERAAAAFDEAKRARLHAEQLLVGAAGMEAA